MGKVIAALLLAAGASLLAACGGGSETVSSTEIVVNGKVQAATGTVADGGAQAKAAGDPIIVSVQSRPEIRTTVAEDGTFTLRGLPAGSFTLVFVQGGEIIGTINFTEVAINQQITITIQLLDGEAVLVDEDRRGIGHAGVELEGLVQNVVTLNLTGDSRFVIAGRTVIARPGVTAIRKGTDRKTVEDVKVGVRVHVKGALVENSQDILAHEIKLQEDATAPGGGGGGAEAKITICHIPPGNPSKKHTISIGESAWPAHQAHGDTKGACPP